MSFSLALNFLGDSHLRGIEAAFKEVGCKEILVCGKSPEVLPQSCKIIAGYGIEFGHSLREAIFSCQTEVLAILLKPIDFKILPAFKDWVKSSLKSEAAFSYSSHYIGARDRTEVTLQPCIEYQSGSVRDDFDFGPLLLLNVAAARELFARYPQLMPDDVSALYGLRLASSLTALPARFVTPAYQTIPLLEEDAHHSHFAYASSAGASTQKALEHTFTEFSKIAGFFLPQPDVDINYEDQAFPVEASVIIPVRNRVGKVEQAVQSALGQKTGFSFNVIVVDNHSTDGTTTELAEIAERDSRLQHLIPQAKDLGIGGCWQLAVSNQNCGRFSVQLDSDDLYSSDSVLQRIVDCFRSSKAAAVVGSYLLVDRDLKEIPPGAIEHREWTDSNGHNNALRINGFGAPRAYYTPIIRRVGFPNVSYGEDYFAMLSISREFRIARIYEHLYLCRRWEGNSDAAPGVEKMNGFHSYKDSIRSAEIEARRKINL